MAYCGLCKVEVVDWGEHEHIYEPIPQGWQCPSCKTIYNPNVEKCGRCNVHEHDEVCDG